MEYWGIVREAWAITRRTRPLWWLGLISAAQGFVYALVVMMISLPMAAIPRVLVYINSADASATDVFASGPGRSFIHGTDWIAAHWGLIVGGVVLVMAVWVVLGVFDVASQPGLITQTVAVAEKREARVAAGLRDGFRLWWRTVGLLAIAVLPGLLYLAAMALVLFFTVSLPLMRQQLPSGATAFTAQLMLSPLSALVTLVAVPLGVIVQLALREAVLGDLPVGAAFWAGWRLLKTRLVEVVLVFLTITGVSIVVIGLVSILLTAIAAVLGVVVGVILTAGGGATAAWVVGVAAGVVWLAAFIGYSAVLFAFTSAFWTLSWRRLVVIQSTAVPSPIAGPTSVPATLPAE